MKKWLIVYSSVTGNTKQIAEAIYDGFGEDMANIFAIRDEFNLEDYDNIAVGYWLTRGEPDKMVQELLKKLNNIAMKQIGYNHIYVGGEKNGK